MPLGAEVNLGPVHTVLDEVPAPRERGTAARFYSAHVYCGQGRPSQLLLSSCTQGRPKSNRVTGLKYNGLTA